MMRRSRSAAAACFAVVPRGQLAGQGAGATDLDVAGAQRGLPRELPDVPAREGFVARDDLEIGVMAGRRVTELELTAFHQEPEAPIWRRLLRKLEPHDDPLARQLVSAKVYVGPRPQHERRITVLRLQIDPGSAPRGHRLDHVPQRAAGRSESILATSPPLLGFADDDAVTFEGTQSLTQE